VPFTLALKIQIAQYFLQLHSAALKTAYITTYKTNYPITGSPIDFHNQESSQQLLLSTIKRSLDGEKIFSDVMDGSFKTKNSISPADDTDIDKVLENFKTWYQRIYSQPHNVAENAWDGQNLSYGFTAAAPKSDGSQLVLNSPDYCQGRLDWYSFDVDIERRQLDLNQPDYVPELSTETPISFIPTGTAFKGMPNQRFWEMEE